jgi:hypothetical protein
MPTIKFWVDGIETTDQTEGRLLTGAERVELARKLELSTWIKLVEKLAGVAAALCVLIGTLCSNRSLGHRWGFAGIALTGLAIAVRFVLNRR